MSRRKHLGIRSFFPSIVRPEHRRFADCAAAAVDETSLWARGSLAGRLPAECQKVRRLFPLPLRAGNLDSNLFSPLKPLSMIVMVPNLLSKGSISFNTIAFIADKHNRLRTNLQIRRTMYYAMFHRLPSNLHATNWKWDITLKIGVHVPSNFPQSSDSWSKAVADLNIKKIFLDFWDPTWNFDTLYTIYEYSEI